MPPRAPARPSIQAWIHLVQRRAEHGRLPQLASKGSRKHESSQDRLPSGAATGRRVRGAGGAAPCAVTPAQVHQTASLTGRGKPRSVPIKAMKREAGARHAASASALVASQLAGRRSGLWGQERSGHTHDGWGLAQDDRRTALVAPSRPAYLLYVHGGEVGGCSARRHLTRLLQAVLHPVASSVRSMAPIYSPPKNYRPPREPQASSYPLPCRLQPQQVPQPSIRAAPAAGQSDHPHGNAESEAKEELPLDFTFVRLRKPPGGWSEYSRLAAA